MSKIKHEKIDCADLFSKTGARLLSEVIMKYWSGRGYLVFAEGYQLSAGNWGVRSNLVMGLPPKHLGLRG